jgi:Tol biopolymer transport system component
MLWSQLAIAQLPHGLTFIGLENGHWRIFLVGKSGVPRALETKSSPRTAAVSLARETVAYIGADGHIYQMPLAGGPEQVLVRATAERAFTQPAFSWDGRNVFVVELKGRSSVDTEIVELATSGKIDARPITSQPGAQFEPRAIDQNRLLYSSVACVVGCGRIIQEIWIKNILTGEARQISLVNAIARHATLSRDGKWLYFSSDKAGNYHLWRQALDEGRHEQLTRGVVTDSHPNVDRDGTVYFIRQSPKGTRLMRLGPDARESVIALPDAISDLRDLSLSQ